MMDESSCRPRKVDGDGAAKRRRQRRLRSWLRHEQQTVAAVLATVFHHSYPKVDTAHDGLRAQRTVTSTREGEVHEKHAGLRAQNRPLPGTRPGVLPDPEPQVRAATAGCVAAAGAPLLTVPSFGGSDAIDDTSVHFLLEMALLSPDEVEQLRRAERKLAREKEEEEREEKRTKSRTS